ncbi:hypothetical protein WH50_10835 [Pokkaliibacter plantistimulans]|uniref:Uncharacterized protein n=2 Tax=Pseudomonadota TaxID=1224 RepID=A0ABX5LX69_9GAMM|nr:hypothetical protein C4K68_21185 [Pokkaliibacter plantistimulans]PXF31264.1 hypothetical protein WH50_10835 [Pokkaliibacter plantistimulans]
MYVTTRMADGQPDGQYSWQMELPDNLIQQWIARVPVFGRRRLVRERSTFAEGYTAGEKPGRFDWR